MEINQETNLSGTEDNTVLQNMINPAINKTKLQQDKLHKGVYSYVNGEVFACKREININKRLWKLLACIVETIQQELDLGEPSLGAQMKSPIV